MFTGLMTGVSGIRGVVGEGMTPEVAVLWSGGFGTWVKGGKVVIGRDSRPSGNMLNNAVIAGLLGAGCDVDDIGVAPTPEVAMAVEKRGAAGGIVITASHNPQEWNALKFVRHDGRMLTNRDFNELESIVTEGPLRSVKWDKLGRYIEWDGADYMYLNAVTGLDILDLDRLRSKRFRVAIDCINSAGSKIYPDLLKALGCEIFPINTDGSGIFQHPPEPNPENIGDLCESVKANRCQVGFAVDPDGDRLAAVDERGEPLGEELTLALAVKAVLEKKKGAVVVNSLTSQAISDVAASYDVECHRTKVGEANVAVGMKELNAVIGGEGNGGIIFPELHLVRDSGVGMALILNYLAGTKRKLSLIWSDLPDYKMIKSAYPIGNSDVDNIMQFVTGKYDHNQISRIDGVRVTFDDGWVQVRPSNTEPILRIYSEAQSEDTAKKYMDQMMAFIDRAAGEEKHDEI